MSNVLAIRKLAAITTVEHFFCNVSAFEIPADDVFDLFMKKMSDAIAEQEDNFFDMTDDDAPVVWEPYEHEGIGNLYDFCQSMYNAILINAVAVGLLDDADIIPIMSAG